MWPMVVIGSPGLLSVPPDGGLDLGGISGMPTSESPHRAMPGSLGCGAGSLSGGKLGPGTGGL